MKREKPHITLSRTLRKHPTDAEKRLWKHLRKQQLEGLKFRRQESIGSYIVDFVCYETRMIVEADGGQHSESRHDEKRDYYLKGQKFKVLRFWNTEILKNTEGVLEAIREECRKAILEKGRD